MASEYIIGRTGAVMVDAAIKAASQRALVEVEAQRLHDIWQDGATNLEHWGEMTQEQRFHWRVLARVILTEKGNS